MSIAHVEQRRLWRPDDHPEGPQRGDCLRACVASIFACSYEEAAGIDAYGQTIDPWLVERVPGLSVSQQMLGDTWKGPEEIGDHVRWPTSHYERGYWIACIWSPRIPDVEEFGCGCPEHSDDGQPDPECRWCHGKPETRSMGIRWGLHAVVMSGAHLAWDPHPQRAEGTLYFRAAMRFVATEPARLLSR